MQEPEGRTVEIALVRGEAPGADVNRREPPTRSLSAFQRRGLAEQWAREEGGDPRAAVKMLAEQTYTPSDLPPLDGPLLAWIPGAFPADLCREVHADWRPEYDRSRVKPGELLRQIIQVGDELVPRLWPEAIGAERDMPMVQRLGDGRGMVWHFDNELEGARLIGLAPKPAPRIVIAMQVYCSDADDYEGGELVLDLPDGERRIRPSAGDLAFIRGDVWHHVTPVTSGARFALKCHVFQPAQVDRPEDVFVELSDKEGPHHD